VLPLYFEYVSVSQSLADPAGSSPLVAAIDWLKGTLLGTIALTVAIVAVALVGFMMLSGRVNIRRGLTVIVGCFVLFGASSIVAGIQATALGGGEPVSSGDALETTPAVVIPTPSAEDPYAGAAPRRTR